MIILLTQYYKGIGHATRINLIAEQIKKTHDVLIVHHLFKPPLETSVNSITMVTRDMINNFGDHILFKEVMTDRLVNYRINLWKEIINKYKPKVIVFEGFPFCRHQFAYELLEFVEYAKLKNCKLICSIRDFPWDDPHDQSLQDWIAKTQNLIINTYFEEVLVHGDPKVLKLTSDIVQYADKSQIIRNIEHKLYYTGYVCNDNIKPHHKENNTVYVSCGFNKKENLHIFVKLAKQLRQVPSLNFNFPIAQDFLESSVSSTVKDNIKIQGIVPNLWKEIEKNFMFITYGGYNSTMEVLKSGIPAIIIPRREGFKQEQYIRSQIMKPYNVFRVCDNIGKIKDDVNWIIDNYENFPTKCTFDLNGTKRTADRIISYL